MTHTDFFKRNKVGKYIFLTVFLKITALILIYVLLFKGQKPVVDKDTLMTHFYSK